MAQNNIISGKQRIRTEYLFALLVLCLCLGRCSDPTPLINRPLAAPEKKLIAICKNDYGLDVIAKRVENTLWIYAPQEDEFYEIKPSEHGPQEASQPDETLTIHFLKAAFIDGVFHLRYDIEPAKKASQDPGYSLKYNYKFNENRRFLISAVTRSFADVEKREGKEGYYQRIEGDVEPLDGDELSKHKKLVHSHVMTARVPDFFIVIMADIKTGLEFRTTFYLGDILRAATDQSFTEEYTRRIISEPVTGQTNIIGDTKGAHLDYYAMTWPEFLRKQMITRIRFKYQQSSFKPEAKPEEEIIKIVAATLRSYHFDDFAAVELENLSTQEKYRYSKAQISELKDQPETLTVVPWSLDVKEADEDANMDKNQQGPAGRLF